MASRESQGLQVALILFVMVTVVLGVTTYIYFRKAEEKIKERDSARTDAQNAQQAMRRMEFQNQAMKHLVGYKPLTEDQLNAVKQGIGGDAEMKEIFANWDEDWQTFGAGQEKATANYRTLPGNLITAIRKLNDQYTEANKQVVALRDERDKIRQAEEARVVKVEGEAQKAAADLAAERIKFNQERTRISEEKNQLAVALPQKDQAYQQLANKYNTDVEQLERQLTTIQQLNQALKDRREAEKETTYERPDGEITWVNQRSNIVWINLGAADGVQVQMTFSVYDQKETGITTGKVKGRVEVTRVMESHLSEARIVENPLSDPILPGDKVYSPTFRKGQKTRFALTGFLDIDGDDKSDREKVKSIIRLNGGVVDAELLEDGTVAGKLTIDTKFLVIGERPTEGTNPKLLDGHSRMVESGSQYGIETITLNTLLDRMGYYKQSNVQSLQGGGTGGAGSEGPAVPGGFRPRTPGTAY